MSHAALDTDVDAPDALLERAAELSTLTKCLETVRRSSRGQVVLVGGEAGIGKTSLLRRFCDELNRPARVLWGACDPLFTPRPLGPLLALGHESGGELGVAVESGMPYEVMTSLADELRERAPAVFVLEDVHWADEATLDVLRLLARRVETVPALVLVSYRDDELDGAHPLRLVLGELRSGRSITRLKIGRLSSEAVAELAQPHRVNATELYRKTAGLPVLRHRGDCRGNRWNPGHGQGRRARPCRAPELLRKNVLKASRSCRNPPRSGCWRRSPAKPPRVSPNVSRREC